MSLPDAQWWVINGSELLAALHRAHDGENPDLLYTELYANTEQQCATCGGTGEVPDGTVVIAMDCELHLTKPCADCARKDNK